MKTPIALRTTKAQRLFETGFIVVVLLLLPMLPLGKYSGGVAMLIASVVGLIAYFALYGTRLRRQSQVNWMILALIIGAAMSVVFCVWTIKGLAE